MKLLIQSLIMAITDQEKSLIPIMAITDQEESPIKSLEVKSQRGDLIS